ncbi:hypothetical protein RCL1_002017 [Eukaryota sp. TZLM3-RCL]
MIKTFKEKVPQKLFIQTTLPPMKKSRPTNESDVDISSSDEDIQTPQPPIPSTTIPATSLLPLSPVQSPSASNTVVVSPSNSNRQRTSDVHPFFSEPADDGSIYCKLCKQDNITKSYKRINTDTMRTHLNKHHCNWKNITDNPLFPGAPAPAIVAK